MVNYSFEKKYSNPTEFYWFEKAFSREELDKIYYNLELIPFERAEIQSGETSGKTRRSNIKWIPYNNPEWDWLYERLMELATIANEELWGFDLHTAPEQIQYTEYDANELGHYDWHQDIGPRLPSLRKVSITVQLSESDEYEGGDLDIWLGGEMTNCATTARGAGNVVIFPSYMPHRVTPVTRGLRRSFVLWLGGEHYK